GTPRVLKALSWRRDCLLATTGVHTPRTLDVEFFLGDGDYLMISSTYASNYTNTPSNVFLRKNLNCPDHTTLPDFQPAPWDVPAVFDTPYVYLGLKDLTWEAVVYSATSTVGYYCDAYTQTTLAAGFSTSGTGCTTSNGVMKLRSNIVSSNATVAWTVAWA